MTENQQSFDQRYREGQVPWDDPLPPPEVMDVASQLPAGRALDLGCGRGRVSIYLAQHGWETIGVDFAPTAIIQARERSQEMGLADRVSFFVGSVTHLDFLSPPYDLITDIGCLHTLTDEDVPLYIAEVTRLLRPGGIFMLFARLREGEPSESGPKGIVEEYVLDLFRPAFALDRIAYGTSGLTNWKSAWFWLKRNMMV